MGIAILSSKRPNPFSVGVTELDKANKAMKELNKLKVNKETYQDAVDSKNRYNWNWITGDDAQRAKIEKQTKLEKEVLANLSKIAAANVHNPDAVSPETMKAARNLQYQLHDRLLVDEKRASQADGDDDSLSSYEDEALIAMRHSSDLKESLDVKPDTIPLGKTDAFVEQLTKLHDKIEDVRSDYDDAKLEKNGTGMSKARKQIENLGTELAEMHDQHFNQVGPDGHSEFGVADARKNALPDGDAMKAAYAEQFKVLGKSDVRALLSNSETRIREIVKDYTM